MTESIEGELRGMMTQLPGDIKNVVAFGYPGCGVSVPQIMDSDSPHFNGSTELE